MTKFHFILVENDISWNTQLTKGRPLLIFWLEQMCFDAVKAEQNDQFCVGLIKGIIY